MSLSLLFVGAGRRVVMSYGLSSMAAVAWWRHHERVSRLVASGDRVGGHVSEGCGAFGRLRTG